MADRVSVSITIGGDLAASDRDRFVAIIADEGLSVEWDGPNFDVAQLREDGALTLCAHEVAWGRLDDLEAFCVEQRLPFARWSGGCPGAFDPERAVFNGSGEPRCFGASEDDEVMIGRQTAAALGSFAAIIANFDAADFVVPPLRLTG